MNSSDVINLEIRLGVVEKLLDGMGRKLEHIERSVMRLDLRATEVPVFTPPTPDEWEIDNAEGKVEKKEDKPDPDAELDAILGK